HMVSVGLRDGSVPEGLTELRARLGEVLCDPTARCLQVDVSGLERLSSPVVAALLWAKRRCLARGVEVEVVGTTGAQRAQLARTGLAAALDVELRRWWL